MILISTLYSSYYWNCLSDTKSLKKTFNYFSKLFTNITFLFVSVVLFVCEALGNNLAIVLNSSMFTNKITKLFEKENCSS